MFIPCYRESVLQHCPLCNLVGVSLPFFIPLPLLIITLSPRDGRIRNSRVFQCSTRRVSGDSQSGLRLRLSGLHESKFAVWKMLSLAFKLYISNIYTLACNGIMITGMMRYKFAALLAFKFPPTK